MRIDLEGKVSANTVGRGHFTLSGVLSDTGRFVDYVESEDSHRRIFFGTKGTIRMLVTIDPDPYGKPTTWTITKGTKAYAGLRGKGSESGSAVGGTINVTMRGTVSH